MLLSKVKEYAQELVEKGLSEDEIKDLVAKKIGEEDVTDEDGTVVKDINLELEEKEDEDLEITIKKIAKKAVEDDKVEVKANKVIAYNSQSVSYVERPTKHFADCKIAECFAHSVFSPEQSKMLLGNKALTTYSSLTDADGGYYDPEQALGSIVKLIAEYNPYKQDCLVVPMTNSTTTFIPDDGELAGYYVGEATAATEVKLALTQKTLSAKKVMVLSPVTSELIADSTLAEIGDLVAEKCARAVAKKEQWAIYKSDGTDDNTDGNLTGLESAITGVDSNDSTYTVSGNWGALTLADLSTIVGNIPSYCDQSKLSWYGSLQMFSTLDAIQRATGGTSYIMSANTKPIRQILGYPYKVVEQMSSAFVEDGVGLLFGDLSKTIAFGDRKGVQISASPDFYFSQDVVTFRCISRHGVNVFNPGTSSKFGGTVAVVFSAVS